MCEANGTESPTVPHLKKTTRYLYLNKQTFEGLFNRRCFTLDLLYIDFEQEISSDLFLLTLFTHCFTSPLSMFMFSLADRYDVFSLSILPCNKNNGRLARDPYRRCDVRLARQEIECGRIEERRQQPVKKQ